MKQFEGFVTITIPNILVDYEGEQDVRVTMNYAVGNLLNGNIDPIRAVFEIQDSEHRVIATVTGELSFGGALDPEPEFLVVPLPSE